MLIDTHCHMNMMLKKEFDTLLTNDQLHAAQTIIDEAHEAGVTHIINVGTSVPESLNCISLAKKYKNVFASIGIHPNDCTPSWRNDLKKLVEHLRNKSENKIVAIGECGMDFHYPDYNAQRQRDAFKAQIELTLEHGLALIVHTRDAGDETLGVLEEFKNQVRGVIHCFSESYDFAQTAIDWGLVLGIGGPLTYPKNESLRAIFKAVPLEKIILETDAPFLPPQAIRGKQNHPKQIATVAHYLAELRQEKASLIAQRTSETVKQVFRVPSE